VKRLYEGAGGAGVCPGEQDCDDFREAYDDPGIDKQTGRRIGKAGACIQCPLRQTKPQPLVTLGPTPRLEQWVARIEELYSWRLAGWRPDPARLTPVEWLGLRTWFAEIEAWERSLRIAQTQIPQFRL
jgi:hypothetical protein